MAKRKTFTKAERASYRAGFKAGVKHTGKQVYSWRRI